MPLRSYTYVVTETASVVTRREITVETELGQTMAEALALATARNDVAAGTILSSETVGHPIRTIAKAE